LKNSEFLIHILRHDHESGASTIGTAEHGSPQAVLEEDTASGMSASSLTQCITANHRSRGIRYQQC
jgi:hypothetical protein